MQSAPSEISQNATLLDQPQVSSPPSQYGLPNTLHAASGGFLRENSPRVPEAVIDDTDTASVSSGGTQRGRSTNTGRIRSRDTSSQEGSPGSRIDEYEKAHAQPRKHTDGMIFQIVPSAKGKIDTVSIETFPNGSFYPSYLIALTNSQQRF